MIRPTDLQGDLVETDVGKLLREIGAEQPELYTFSNRHFISVARGEPSEELFEIRKGRVRQVCELERKTITTVDPLFRAVTHR